jgi:hypothetical protein
MAATLTTNGYGGDPGYQTGYFSGPVGAPVDQAFFNAAFAGHINTNKIYKDAYNCNILGMCNMSTWLDEFMGYETDCHPNYTLLEYNGFRHQIRSNTTVVIPAYPGTQNIVLSAKDHFVGGQYVLPQVGNSIALTPSGILADITAVTHATANDTTITVRQRNNVSTSAITVTAGDEMLVLEGTILTDCVCPSGQFKFRDLPIERDIAMIDFALKGSLCGDALEKCQFLKIPFLDEKGDTLDEMSPWYTAAQQDMYRDFERRKYYETLLNPSFGVIPTLRALGLKLTSAVNGTITTDDIRDWKKLLDIAGVAGREYAIFAGTNVYSQFQRMLLEAGVVQLNYLERPLNECSWINMEYCGIKVEGMTLHIYDECSFSSGKELGSVGMNFPDSAIFVPLSNRPYDEERSVSPIGRNGYTEKMFTRVYFRSIQGRTYDMVTDSNGFLNGPNGRNTFGAGCKTHEWSVETRFANEVHCPKSWLYIGLS